MKVNLGCGRDVRPGWVNVDKHTVVMSSGLQAAFDVIGERPVIIRHDVERDEMPFPDDSVDVVYASHFLEHVGDLDRVVGEVHRVLRPGGIFEVRVPYGLKSLYNPWHRHAFERSSFDVFTREDRGLQSGALFAIRSLRVYRGPPMEWHVRRHLPRVYEWLWGDGHEFRWTVGLKREIHVVMEKVTT